MAALLGWGASVVDALVTGAPEAPRVALRPSGAGAGVALRIAF